MNKHLEFKELSKDVWEVTGVNALGWDIQGEVHLVKVPGNMNKVYQYRGLHVSKEGRGYSHTSHPQEGTLTTLEKLMTRIDHLHGEE